jgi:HSP20 family molecular chaperone IbpA
MTTELSNRNSDVATTERKNAAVTFSPRVDIWEDDNEVRLYADLPGVAAEDLDIQFENRELRIHGKVAPRDAQGDYLYGEYGIGDFHRTFAIGETVDADNISAELSHGVLTLHLPKTDAVKPRRIEVNHG